MFLCIGENEIRKTLYSKEVFEKELKEIETSGKNESILFVFEINPNEKDQKYFLNIVSKIKKMLQDQIENNKISQDTILCFLDSIEKLVKKIPEDFQKHLEFFKWIKENKPELLKQEKKLQKGTIENNESFLIENYAILSDTLNEKKIVLPEKFEKFFNDWQNGNVLNLIETNPIHICSGEFNFILVNPNEAKNESEQETEFKQPVILIHNIIQDQLCFDLISFLKQCYINYRANNTFTLRSFLLEVWYQKNSEGKYEFVLEIVEILDEISYNNYTQKKFYVRDLDKKTFIMKEIASKIQSVERIVENLEKTSSILDKINDKDET